MQILFLCVGWLRNSRFSLLNDCLDVIALLQIFCNCCQHPKRVLFIQKYQQESSNHIHALTISDRRISERIRNQNSPQFLQNRSILYQKRIRKCPRNIQINCVNIFFFDLRIEFEFLKILTVRLGGAEVMIEPCGGLRGREIRNNCGCVWTFLRLHCI